MIRSDLRTEIQDNLQENPALSGGIFGDALLNRHIDREIRSLPAKDIYLEELWETTLDTTTDYSDGIALPDNTIKVESVERNDGTSTYPDWNSINGADNYQTALFLPYRITTPTDIRVKIRKSFTVPTDDTTDLDVPEDKMEIVVWGVTIRCYKILIGYLRGSQSWDSVTKPGDLSIPSVQAWIRDAQKYYQELVQQYATVPRPRDISLVD